MKALFTILLFSIYLLVGYSPISKGALENSHASLSYSTNHIQEAPTSGNANQSHFRPIAYQNSTVVICGGKYATKFHSTSNCRGLNNCKGGVYSVSLSEARKQGFTSCLICY